MNTPNATTRPDQTGTANPGSLHPVCSALGQDAITAIKKDNPIGSYDAYAEWLASHPQGYLYLKQAISALAWQLHKVGNLPMMRQAVDEVTGAERDLVDVKVKAPNVRMSEPRQ